MNSQAKPVSNLTATVRREKILELAARQPFVSTREISRDFAISGVSARKDLDFLEKRGLMVRSHGGGQIADVARPMLALSERQTANRAQKEMIGRTAAELLKEPNLRIYLDTGSTILQLAKHLPEKMPMLVYTNSLTTIAALEVRPMIRVIALGGHVDFGAKSMSGPMTDAQIDRLQFDFAFLGAENVEAEGFGCGDVETAQTLRRVMERAFRVFVLADSAKCRRRSSAIYAGFGEVAGWITDEGVPSRLAALVRKGGSNKLIVAKAAVE